MAREHVDLLVRKLRTDPEFRSRVDAIVSDDDLDPLLAELSDDGFEGDLRDLAEAIRRFRQRDPPPRRVPVEEFDMGLEFRKGLVRVVGEIDRGYRHVMRMYLVAFYLGVGLVITAVVLAVSGRSEVLASVLGTLGVADVVAGMIFRPAQELQTSRGNLAQLQAAFTGWANDIFNWNQYLMHLDRHAEASGQPPPFDTVRDVSVAVLENTEAMMRLIEEYCEDHAPAVRTARSVTIEAADQ